MAQPIKVYLGSSLFSHQEQLYNAYLADKIRKLCGDKVELYVPQENEEINDKTQYANSIDIYNGDMERLEQSDILIALLDGVVVDPGLATEIGAFAMMEDKVIFGMYSDVRQGHYNNQNKIDALNQVAESQFSYVNLFTIGAIKSNGRVVKTETELLELVRAEIEFRYNQLNK